MSAKRYTEEFKVEAVNQVLDRGHSVAEVAQRLGVSQHSLYQWIKQRRQPVAQPQGQVSPSDEVRRLKAELKRVTEERDILKKGRSVLCQAVRVRYAFIKAHAGQYSVRRLCKAMSVHPSGYYAWHANPLSPRAKDNQRLLGLLKQAWLESGGVYGYRKLTLDMRDLGERCGKHRVARLLKAEGLRSQSGYRRRPAGRAGKPAAVAPNHLQRQFTVNGPNQSWVTDITYIRTHEGWLYLSVVIGLWSRMVVGWSMGQRIDTQLVLDALLMALWRRRPHQQVLIHSDQGCQFTGHTWQSFLREHNLLCSMSRRGNCHDNAVAESFFQLLKRERVRRQIYVTRQQAKSDVFNYIEMFYNPTRRHSSANGLSPVEFEQRHSQRLAGV
ncbi:IS3 family transposase [Ralstonia pseudosolanacearum]|uniref:IS3 family transposase n=1 Tax=Ralstonia pseudosolanacearum TaxID=1310165 RepID=UPI000BBD4428|nr:IS3 family transposase [Ralstonia pseudosolanacearum]UYR04792.1 IS3 family transposase [Ralstonia pseudosolanacearum]UYR13623.1 IS3 family transposase [Ralstonia pseudosolanacearum]